MQKTVFPWMIGVFVLTSVFAGLMIIPKLIRRPKTD